MEVYMDFPQSQMNQNITGRKLIGYFSLLDEEKYAPDLSELKYYKPPSNLQKINFNLNDGYELVRHKVPTDSKLDFLLKWISENFHRIAQKNFNDHNERLLDADFVCFRGLMTTLLCSFYETKENWIICASKFHGTIYLYAFDTEEKKRREANQTPMDIRRCTWGYKFEQFLLSDKPENNPDLQKPLNEWEEFNCIFQSQFKAHSLIYGAEMDGVCSDHEIKDLLGEEKIDFVELKTNRQLDTEKARYIFQRYKPLKWYFQSYLVGIETIVCGFRNDEGIVGKIQHYSIEEIERISQRGKSHEQCKMFCHEFLSLVKRYVTKDYDECVYEFSWNPSDKRKIRITKTDPFGKYNFIPDWYVQKAEQYRIKNMCTSKDSSSV